PSIPALRCKELSRLITIPFLHGAHLIPVYGFARIPANFRYYVSLDAFKAFHVNKYIDHHANEIAYSTQIRSKRCDSGKTVDSRLIGSLADSGTSWRAGSSLRQTSQVRQLAPAEMHFPDVAIIPQLDTLQ
ncbi:hypothetical protein K438DRAFT_2045337, partial [Mycena galopus ATCC 62051]